MTPLNILLFAVIVLQFLALSGAIFWRMHRKRNHPKSAPTPPNGKSKQHHFTPAMGVQRVE